MFPTVEKPWQWPRPRNARLLPPPELAVHFPGGPWRVSTVGARELRTLLGGVERAVLDRRTVPDERQVVDESCIDGGGERGRVEVAVDEGFAGSD